MTKAHWALLLIAILAAIGLAFALYGPIIPGVFLLGSAAGIFIYRAIEEIVFR